MRANRYTVRHEEFERLKTLFAESDGGSGNVVVINGPIGNGSATLLQSFAQWANGAGAVVLGAACSRAERTFPLGVISQLVRNNALPPGTAQAAERLLGEDVFDAEYDTEEPEAARQANARLVHALATLILDLAREHTLVIGIDDLRHADAASLQVLLYLQRRLRSARIMLVLNQWTSPRPTHPLFDAELFRQPYCTRMRLDLLTPAQVGDAARHLLGGRTSDDFVASALTLTGGNPLLLVGLLEDSRAALPEGQPAAAAPLVTGSAFGQAVLTCLHAWEPLLAQVARAAAVLGQHASVRDVARLLCTDSDTVDEALSVMRDAGLVTGARFRHEAVRDAIVEGTSPSERKTLKLRAARMLHKQGADASVTARHLLGAGDPDDGAWTVPVLRTAAEQALVDGQVDLAVECLELAQSACADEGQHAEVTAELARSEWRVNPSAAARHLPTLKLAFEAGILKDSDFALLAGGLLWHGRFDEAADLLGRWKATSSETAAEIFNELRLFYPSVLADCPDLLEAMRRPPVVEGAEGVKRMVTPSAKGGVSGRSLSTAARSVFKAVLEKDQGDDAVRAAQQLLQGCRLGERTIKPVTIGLLTLVTAGRLDDASRWCSILIQEAGARGATTWKAMLEAVVADIAYRRGDLAGAEEHARVALSAMSPQSWGTCVGRPTSTLLLALTTMGKYEAAEALLRRAVPQGMFETVPGLSYLYARGRYHLATGYAFMAMDDFTEVGEKLTRWGLDFPKLVPWRSGAVEANLALGERDLARMLAERQLQLAGEGPSRVRGITLRILAATSDLACRPELLRESMELLQQCGAKLELARAHDELSRTYKALGDFSKAGMMADRAAEVMGMCGASARLPAQRKDQCSKDVVGLLPLAGREIDVVDTLSTAERRVAGLAALGHTNREISLKLFITVSTVEQHLTRVYRKLNVARRANLPTELSVNIPDTA